MNAPEPSSTTIVTRPPPGLARGVWETSPIVFYVGGLLLILGAATAVALRFHLFRKR